MQQCPKCGKRFFESNTRVCDADGFVLKGPPQNNVMRLDAPWEGDSLVGSTIHGRSEERRQVGDQTSDALVAIAAGSSAPVSQEIAAIDSSMPSMRTDAHAASERARIRAMHEAMELVASEAEEAAASALFDAIDAAQNRRSK